MARICVDNDYFSVLPDGRLTLKAQNLGHVGTIVYNTAGSSTQFDKTLYRESARFHIRVVGGGGGGAGAAAAASEICGQGGGGGGGYAETWVTWIQLAALETVTVGAGGTGGVGANPGNNGQQSSFGGWAVGNGGFGSNDTMTSGTIPGTVQGASGGGGFSNSGIVVNGGPGYPGIRGSAIACTSGKGGDTVLGFGGIGRSSNGPGLIGGNYGGGGSGAVAVGGSQTGGAGRGGVVYVDIYY